MLWLIAAAVLLCLALIPLGFSAVYNEKALNVWVLAGPVRLHVYPRKAKRAKQKTKNTENARKDTEKGGSYRTFLQVIKPIVEFLDHFRRKIRVNKLELKLILAGDEPDKLAVNYGRAWAVLGNLMPHLERAFVIKRRDVDVACDFDAEETLIYARLDATITVARAIHLLSRHGIKILKELGELKKLRKGGAQE